MTPSVAALGLIVFWVVVIRLWIVDGPQVPLIFIGVWFLALFVKGYFGLPGFAVWSFQAVLAAVLLIVERYKSAL
jgi:hypothetical protein